MPTGKKFRPKDRFPRGKVSVRWFCFIACEARAANLALTPHEDPAPLVQAYGATLQMFAESADAVANARPFIERAQARAPQATPRERRYIAAVAAWVAGDIREAIRLHEPLEAFLRQRKDEVCTLSQGYRELEQILGRLETES